MTVGDLLAKTRALLRLQSDDAYDQVSDEMLYSHYLDVRALLIERDLNKWEKISMDNFQTFCMPLELVKDDCEGCLQNDCYVLQSKFKMPGTMNNVLVSILTITTPTGAEIHPGGLAKYNRERHSMTNKDKFYYELVNGFLRIYGTTVLQTVFVRLIAEDPLELKDIYLCDSEGNILGSTCYDPLTEDFPIDRSLVTYAMEFVVKRIMVGMNVTEDQDNNAQSDPKARRSYSPYTQSATQSQ